MKKRHSYEELRAMGHQNPCIHGAGDKAECKTCRRLERGAPKNGYYATERNLMIIKFGNLVQPRHSNDTEKPDAKEKVEEMMIKLHEAGFVRQENIANGVPEGKFYHIFDLPHQIEFGGSVSEAIEIMTPYSDYMQPIQVVG